MIKEDYVSFDVAKLLKEKGFVELTNAYYDKDGQCYITPNSYIPKGYLNLNSFILCPTFQMTIKWLRNKGFHIFVPVEIDYDEDERGKKWYHQPTYYPEIIRVPDGERMYDEENLFATPEQAIDAAIKYCLENLI